ncbi:hypothetical protein AWF46_17620 [Escherichia coli]|nr:hypothetical protein AWF46_17620 [Escherichia coli]KUW13742.1 hypothetical protein AWF54_18480 [Escherichia coli]
MSLKRIFHCAAALAAVLLTPNVQAADNLHFYGNLLSKSCTLVVQGEVLAEVIAVDVVDNDVTKLNFNGFPVTDGTGGRRNQCAMKCDIAIGRLCNTAITTE